MLVPSLYIFLMKDFNISASFLGFIYSIVSLFFGIGSLPISFLYNKFGARKLLLISQLGIATSSLIIFFNNELIPFILFSTLLGLFSSVHHPIALTLISERFHKNISKANAFHGVFGSLGVSLGPYIAYLSTNNYDNWQIAFFAVGMMSLFLSLLTFFFIPKNEQISKGYHFKQFLLGSQRKKLLIFFPLSLLIGFNFTAFNTFIPSVFNLEFGQEANLLISGIMIIGIIGQILAGILGDIFSRFNILSFVSLILFPLFLSMTYISSSSLILISIVLAVGMYSIQPLLNSIIKDITVPEIRSIIYGANFFLMFGVSGFASFAGGLIADSISYKFIFPIFSIFFPICILLILNLKKINKTNT
jgi:MFS family permease